MTSSGGFGMMFDLKGPERLRFEWTATTRKVIAQIAPVILMRLKQEAPVGEPRPGGRIPGGFRNSIGFRTETEPGVVKLNFVSTAPYAQYVIKGTHSGPFIAPQTALMLRYHANGGFIFASSIYRGATPKNIFNERVAEEVTPFVMSMLKNSIVVVGT
jgi:hypothetical protein